MAESSNLINFTRDEFVTSLRVLLVGFAEWVELILSHGIIPRAAVSVTGPEAADLSTRLSAGPVIENAFLLARMPPVYDFVTTGRWSTEDLEELGHELQAFEQLCRLDLESPGGVNLAPSIDRQRLPPPQRMCQLVLDHANARMQLLQGADLTLPQVAMLASLSEKTVRMAANPKNDDPLVTVKDGHSTYVEADEALRWLSARSGFKPTVMTDATHLPREYTSVGSLAGHCSNLRGDAGISLPELFKQLGWSRTLQQCYRALEDGSPDLDPRPLTVSRLIKLGEALGISDARQFARNAAVILAPIAIERECAATTPAR